MAESDQRQQFVTIITENRNLKNQTFVHTDDQLSTDKLWEKWLVGTEREFRYFNIVDSANTKDALLIYDGRELARLEKSPPNPTDPNMNEYDNLKAKLNDYFSQSVTSIMPVTNFLKCGRHLVKQQQPLPRY